MKHIMVKMMLLLFILYSLPAFSDRMLIHGKPAVLKMQQGFFTFPPTYFIIPNDKITYRYVKVAGTERVCFLKTRAELAPLDMIQMTIVEIEFGKKLRWYCYRFDRNYFEVVL